jgi:hypothetical protein
MINFNSMPYKDESSLRYVTIVKPPASLRLCVCVSASKKGISTVVDVRIGELKEIGSDSISNARAHLSIKVPRTSEAREALKNENRV